MKKAENMRINKIAKINLITVIIVTVLLTLNSMQAQALTGQSPAPATETKPENVDSLGRQTPKGLIDGFIQAVKNENYERAAEFLDLNKIPEDKRIEKGIALSKGLQEILDQSGSVIANSKLSLDPNGDQNDGLANDLDIVGTMKINGEKIDILAQNFSDTIYGHVWKISGETVKNIPIALEKLSTGYIDRVLPDVLIVHKLYGVPVGHWLAIFTLAVGSLLLSFILSFFVIIVIRFFWKTTSSGYGKYILDAFIWPIRLYIAVAIFAITINFAGISIIARQHFSIISGVITWLSLAWIFWAIIDLLTETIKTKLLREKKRSALSAVVFFRRTARTLLGVIFLTIASKNMGMDITAGLTALGIGGLALAFGAQKTLENFVASLNIIVEQPLRIGDFCKIGDIKGTVLDIGMRSTKIQTQQRTIITIPNGTIATMPIENYALRDRYLIDHNVGVRYETTPDQMRYILVKIREMLYSHPCIDPEVVRVRFNRFDSSSLNMQIYTYIYAEGFEEFLEVQEDILLHIMDIIEKSGSEFAFPSQTLYLNRGTSLSKDKQKNAEEEVKKWREENALKLHRFSEEQINQISNSLEYPPLSSANDHINYF